MSHGIPYALGALICFGLADLIYKRAARAGVRPHHFIMVQGWCFASGIALYGLVTHTLRFGTSALWGGLAGVFAFTAFYNFARSLKTGAVSVNAPIFRLNFAVTAVLAVAILGEPVTAIKLAGLALVPVAAWLLLGGGPGLKPDDVSARKAMVGSIARVLIATLALGLGNFVYKLGLGGGATPATLLVAQAAIFILLATSLVYVVDGRVKPPRSVWPHGAPAALFVLSALLFTLESLVRGEASIVVPITQMGFVVTVVLGVWVLGEPFTARKAIGLLAAVAAIVFLGQS